jgi:hypothetical protein
LERLEGRCGSTTAADCDSRSGFSVNLSAGEHHALQERHDRTGGRAIIDRRTDNQGVRGVHALNNLIADIVVENTLARPGSAAGAAVNTSTDGLCANPINFRVYVVLFELLGDFFERAMRIAVLNRTAVYQKSLHLII